MSRREIREQIFKLLFRVEFNELAEMDEQMRLFYEDEDNNAKEEVQKEVTEKLENILGVMPTIDELISSNTSGWTIDRIGKVELTILRLAVYEIKYDESVPDKVAIDEAIELSKKYGQNDSGSFVNGVLAKVVK